MTRKEKLVSKDKDLNWVSYLPQDFQVSFGRINNLVRSRIPKSVLMFYLDAPKHLRWAILTFAVTNSISIGLAIFLVFPVTLLSQPFSALGYSIQMILVGVFLGLDFGSKAFCVGLRHRSEPLQPILIRLFVGMLVGAVIPIIGIFIPYIAIFWKKGSFVRRGSQLVEVSELQRHLEATHRRLQLARPHSIPIEPKFSIAGVDLPNYLENLGFFFIGSPGSGKTQAIKKMLSTMKQRPDFRAIVLDRNGELMEEFYSEGIDLLFNPSDVRTINWSHVYETQQGIDPETIATALVPDDSKDRFFSEAAKSLLADLYERCDNNAEVWEIVSGFTFEEIRDFVNGGLSARYFTSETTGGSIVSTMVNSMRFYRQLSDSENGFSFANWGKVDDTRWLWLPIFENESEKYKSLYTMAFELMLRGLLSNEKRSVKTALVIDELGALNQLRSLSRLLSESRKFGGTAILGTQTEAQILKTYTPEDTRIVLQGTATKLILNCRDAQTAESMANIIGKQERIDITRSFGSKLFDVQRNEQIRETHTVLPSEIQALPPLEGFLHIADGSSPARVKIEPCNYEKVAQRFISK